MSAPSYGRPEEYIVDPTGEWSLAPPVDERGRLADLVDDIRTAMDCIERKIDEPRTDLPLWINVLERMMKAFVAGEQSDDPPY